MNLVNALAIEGWMYEEELKWLAETAAEKRMIAEVGCWKGRTTRALADNSQAKIIAIDTWRGTKGEKVHEEAFQGKPEGWLYQEFVNNLMDAIADGRVTPYPKSSTDAARGVKEMGFSFDMIFLDAAHDYDSVKQDILAWRPLLMTGGVLCGHDYDGGRPGVIQAVRELLPHRKLNIGSLWVAQ